LRVINTGLLVIIGYLVPGLLIWCRANVINTPIKQSVIFIKEADVAFTNDYWKVVVNVKLTSYERAIEILRADLAAATEVAHPTPLIDEVHQVQTAVNLLDSSLTKLRRFLPRANRRRGLVNAGGSFLKIFFGTATMDYLADLHATVDTLSLKQGEVIHTLNHQLTYFRWTTR
jgi:hypothetical protein